MTTNYLQAIAKLYDYMGFTYNSLEELTEALVDDFKYGYLAEFNKAITYFDEKHHYGIYLETLEIINDELKLTAIENGTDLREIKELANEFPSLFRGLTGWEIKFKLNELNTSHEYHYDPSEIVKGEMYDEVVGYFDITIDHKDIRCIINVTLEDWDNEEKIYCLESREVVGWFYI